MKLSPVTGTYTPTILSDASGSYANYHIIPSTATKVVTYTGDINTSSTARFNTTYAVAVSPTQAADTYVGKVKYTVVHPNYSNADSTIDSYNVPVNFAGTGIENVTFTATGYPTRTVSTSGSTANLIQGATYTVTATIASGYEFVSWALNGSSYGTLGSTSTNPTTFTPNANSASAVITATGQSTAYTVTISLTNPSEPSAFGSATVYDDWELDSDGLPLHVGGNIIGTFDSAEGTISVTTTTGKVAVYLYSTHLMMNGYVSAAGNIQYQSPYVSDNSGYTHYCDSGVCTFFNVLGNGTVTISGVVWDD